ncbi:MAG: DUF4342 domain-containing protein [Dehalococcoidia bacterium]
MQSGSRWESVKVQGDQAVDKVRELVHEGNVRRIVIKHDEHTIAEFPVTAGVIGAVIAPMLAAVGAVAALVTHCTIDIERSDPRPGDGAADVDKTAG